MESKGDPAGAREFLQRSAQSGAPDAIEAYAQFLDRHHDPAARETYEKMLTASQGEQRALAAQRLPGSRLSSPWTVTKAAGTHPAVVCAAVLAVTTAYVRELGRGLGFPADFSGPMAKPQRMAALTITALVSALEGLWGWHGETMMVGLAVIGVGTAITLALRLRRLARRLAERSGQEGDDA